MGVLTCDRAGCPNIMCHKYSRTYGYICNDCYDELRVALINGTLTIDEFMAEPKREFAKDDLNIITIDMILQEEFNNG